jgi:hypothetical protein
VNDLYVLGFFSKCAEYGLGLEESYALLKLATQPAIIPGAQVQGRPVIGQGLTPPRLPASTVAKQETQKRKGFSNPAASISSLRDKTIRR